MEFTLLGAVVVGVAGLWAALRFFPAAGADAASSRALVDPALGAMGGGILVGRLAAMLATGTNPLANPGDILVVRGGVSTGWATVGALAVLAFAVRPHLVQAFDTVAAASLFGLAGWHAGCLVRNACAGTTTDLPWAIARAPGAAGRHPVELYAAVLLLVAGLVIRRIPIGTGLAAGLALAAAGLIRLATEPLRVSLGGGPRLWYLAAGVVGIGWALLARRDAVRAAEPEEP